MNTNSCKTIVNRQKRDPAKGNRNKKENQNAVMCGSKKTQMNKKFETNIDGLKKIMDFIH